MFVPKNDICRLSRIWNVDNSIEKKIKWRPHDAITHLVFMKFFYEAVKGISKQCIKFQIDQIYESWDLQ